MNRGTYAACGFFLFAIKYNIDRAICWVGFGKHWYIYDYFTYSSDFLYGSEGSDTKYILISLGVTSIPFIWIGTTMTIRRLRNMGVASWAVIYFFIPYVNLLFFLVLCLVPSKHVQPNRDKPQWLARLIPHSRWGSATLAILVTAVLALIFAMFSTSVLGNYGAALFLGIPFLQGLSSAVIYGYHESRSVSQSLGVAASSVAFLALLIFVLALEGALCLLMAAPLGVGIGVIGGLVGHMIQRREDKNVTALVVFMSVPLLSDVEHAMDLEPPIKSVTTKIVVNRPATQVWKQLVTFNELNEPEDIFLKSGIAYPVRAEIKGKGVGSVRYCVFTTGAFVEPIEVWDEPKLLRFSVQKSPPPLIEMSMYDSLNLPHLEGYFQSVKGQFKLIQVSKEKTMLEGTTWYRHDLWPGIYWQLWSDEILHRIHYRVLKHIKQKTEENKIQG
jgi:uncharacterized membrane protein YhaH (DUF805 family)